MWALGAGDDESGRYSYQLPGLRLWLGRERYLEAPRTRALPHHVDPPSVVYVMNLTSV